MRECIPGVPCNSDCEDGCGCDRIGSMTHPFNPEDEHTAHCCSDHRYPGRPEKLNAEADKHVQRVQAALNKLIKQHDAASSRSPTSSSQEPGK